jgi:hypothetical protein
MRSLLLASVAVVVLAFGGIACRRGGPAPGATVAPTGLTPQATHPPAFSNRGGAVATSLPGSVPQPVATSIVMTAPEVRLRLTFAPGDVHVMTASSRMSFDSSLAPTGQKIPPILLDMAVRYEVLDAAGDGSAVVRATFDKMDFRGGDQSASVDLSGVGVRLRLRPDGTYAEPHVERRGEELAAAGLDVDRLADMIVPFRYPDAPVRLGGSFERDIRLAPGQGMPPAVAHARYTLADLTTRQGVAVARLDAQADMAVPAPSPQPGVTFSDGRASLHGTDYANLASGWPVGGEQTMDMSFRLQGAEPSLSGTMSVRAETTYTMH